MAAMDQGKLNSMVASIKGEADNYVTSVSREVENFKKEFNANWVSNAAKSLATEIQNCLGELATAVTNTFDAKNESIKVSVSNFNAREQENISYSGFSFGKPKTDLTLNSTLPSGKVGVADGADLSTINTPMSSLVSSVTTSLDNIVSKVRSADAFDKAEAEALTASVNNIKSNFVTKMDELKNSLSTRMSAEISATEKLDTTNISNLNS